MSRLSREKKREHNHDGRPVAVVAPLDVHVRGGGAASIGGVPVAAVDGEEIQRAVLSHLHRIALATGHPVLASVHDERIGYVVPLRVDPDGSSHFTAEPLRTTATPATMNQAAMTPAVTREPAPDVRSGEPASAPAPVPAPVEDERPAQPRGDKPTYTLQAVPERPGPRYDTPAPGTVTAPTGVFGPPPTMDDLPNPADATPTSPPTSNPTAPPTPPLPPPPAPTPLPLPTPTSTPTPPAPSPLLPHDLISDSAADLERDLKPTPARGFDAVAEAVLGVGDDPRTLQGEDGVPALLGEPVARINEAVRAGRIDAAAGLAERTVLEASGTLGPEHPEVLRLRELTAYIAYLAGDPVRSFHASLDLARIRRRTLDAEAAYGNVQSAATAWRAVRDPLQGLNLGTELLGLWTELTTEEGPAADDVEELESARARMLRLAERARTSGA
ncbi:tetratricopeptide repeat protein [Streptomyces sp. NBC_01485]|uniref:tetratricopeptide repeat protein n=1 Tax=Streptomyces sp. NBC_01485 TaxID=2903884 RepID=UPI002E31B80A|nr:tetratricopeptide repeat protein [Streptomyces sp. NBC_01485]